MDAAGRYLLHELKVLVLALLEHGSRQDTKQVAKVGATGQG